MIIPIGVNISVVEILAGENIEKGDLVNIHESYGYWIGLKADADKGLMAHSIAMEQMEKGSSGKVLSEGYIEGDFVAGEDYFLAKEGKYDNFTGYVLGSGITQYIGTGVSPTILNFDPQQPIKIL